MKAIPNDVTAYKRSPEFTETSVPAALLNDHTTKAGTWGKIVVLEGQLQYTIVEPAEEVVQLNEKNYGVVEPMMKHHVKPLGTVRFYVEFYR